MVHFESVSVRERAYYGDEFDRVMYFDAPDTMAVIQLAAKARINYLENHGIIPSEFYRGVLSLNPCSNNMMMNLSYVIDYTTMLNGYADTGFMYADLEEGADVDSWRQKAADLAADIGGGAVIFDLLGEQSSEEEKKVVAAAEAIILSQPVPESAESMATRELFRSYGRFLFHLFRA